MSAAGDATSEAIRAIVPHPLDAVIFDMDGLLLDTEAAHRETMIATAAAMGAALPEAVFLSLVGIHRDANRRTLAAHFGPDFALDAFYAESDARFEAVVAAGMPTRPGARLILDHLVAAGVPRGVATSTASPEAEQRLARAGLLHLFDTVVTRSDVANPKPAPDPYLLAAERLGARPAHCVALEDSHNGVRAAAAAGMAVIMIPDLLPATEETRGLCVATLPGLADVVAELERAAAERR